MEQWDGDELQSLVAGRVLAHLHVPNRTEPIVITHEHNWVMSKVLEDIKANGPLNRNKGRLTEVVDAAMEEWKNGTALTDEPWTW